MNFKIVAERLLDGQTVQGRPKGNSMAPRIESGQLVTIEPIGNHEIKKRSIVLAKVKGKFYLHLVKQINGPRYLIANNKGRENGWTAQIFGIVTNVED